MNKAIVTTQDPYTIQTLMYLQFLPIELRCKFTESSDQGLTIRARHFTVAWGASPNPSAEDLHSAVVTFQTLESFRRAAAKKRTPDSKKLRRLSDSAADRKQLKSHFAVCCLWFFFPFLFIPPWIIVRFCYRCFFMVSFFTVCTTACSQNRKKMVVIKTSTTKKTRLTHR